MTGQEKLKGDSQPEEPADPIPEPQKQIETGSEETEGGENA